MYLFSFIFVHSQNIGKLSHIIHSPNYHYITLLARVSHTTGEGRGGGGGGGGIREAKVPAFTSPLIVHFSTFIDLFFVYVYVLG